MLSPAITLNLHFCRKLVIFDARLFPPPTKFAPANVSDWIWRPLAPSNQPPLPNISIKSFGVKYIYADLDPWFQCVKYFSVEINMTGLVIGWDWVSLYNSSKLPSNHSSQLLSNCLLIAYCPEAPRKCLLYVDHWNICFFVNRFLLVKYFKWNRANNILNW